MEDFQLFLMRHGRADNSVPDASRVLTSKGKAQVKDVTAQLSQAGILTAKTSIHFFHSGFLRAEETANIVQLSCDAILNKSEHLFPESSPQFWEEEIKKIIDKKAWDRVFLVGHLPYMSKLAMRIVGPEMAMDFTTAQVVHLEFKRDTQKWKLQKVYLPAK